MLLTMEDAYKAELENLPNPERFDKVNSSRFKKQVIRLISIMSIVDRLKKVWKTWSSLYGKEIGHILSLKQEIRV